MTRCERHDIINCKCTESLGAYLTRQFRESPHVRVVCSGWHGVGDHSGGPDRDGSGADRRGQRGIDGGER